MITFRCSSCARPLRVEESLSGKNARCPACRQKTIIPTPLSEIPPDTMTLPPQKTAEEAMVEPATLAPGVSSCEGVTLAPEPPSGSPRDARAPAGYVIDRELGRGGMGVVYKARSLALQRLCALKMILSGAHSGSDEVDRFLVEAQAIARLQHPGIVQVFEVGEHDGRPFMALEFCGGGSLDAKLSKSPLAPEAAAELVRRLAEAVQAAHEAKVIHRDLKPANVLLTEKGEPKVTDFGLAKKLDEQGATRTGSVMGTPSYMPPEQAEGKKDVGLSVDVYALGAILYECLTGRPPFRAATPFDTIMQVLTEEPPSPRQLNAVVPLDLETIALKCLRKEPEKRYASACDLAGDLGRYLKGEPIRARPVGTVERAAKWVRRNAVVAALAAAVFAALAIGTATSVWFAVRADAGARTLAKKVDELDSARAETERARLDALAKLQGSYLAQARARRQSGEPGHRYESLEALKDAASLAKQLGLPEERFLEMRNEAIAAIALPLDFRILRQWPNPGPSEHERTIFDPALDHYVAHLGGGEVGVFSTADSREVARLPGPGKVGAMQMEFSPDGRYLGAVYLNTQIRGHRIEEYRVWDWRRKLVLVRHTRETHPMGWLGWTPDGRFMLRSAYTPDLRLYRMPRGDQDARLEVGMGWSDCAFLPGGDRFVQVGGASAVVRDASTGAVLSKWALPLAAHSVATSPDGRQVATTHARYVLLWNRDNPSAFLKLDGHESDVRSARYNHRGDLLVTTCWDNKIRFWNPTTGHLLLNLQGTAHGVTFSADDRRMGARHGANGLVLIEFSRDGELCSIRPDVDIPDAVSDLAWTPDGRVLATANRDGIRFWTPDARELFRFSRQWAPRILFDQSGRHFYCLERDRVTDWPVTVGADTLRFGSPKAAKLTPIQALTGRLAIDRGGHHLVVADCPGGRVLVFPRGDLTVAPRSLPLTEPHECAVSPDGKWVAATEFQGSNPDRGMALRVWDAATGEVVAARLHDRRSHVAFTGDGKWLVAGDSEAYRFWQVGTWDPRGAIVPRLGDTPLMSGVLAGSPDGRLLAVAHSRWRARLLDATTGRHLATLASGDERQISRMTFSPDSSRLVVAREGSLAHVWDLAALGRQLDAIGLADGFPRYTRHHQGVPPKIVIPEPEKP